MPDSSRVFRAMNAWRQLRLPVQEVLLHIVRTPDVAPEYEPEITQAREVVAELLEAVREG